MYSDLGYCLEGVWIRCIGSLEKGGVVMEKEFSEVLGSVRGSE